MNRTTTVVVALIAAAGLSTMVYAVPEQRALAWGGFGGFGGCGFGFGGCGGFFGDGFHKHIIQTISQTNTCFDPSTHTPPTPPPTPPPGKEVARGGNGGSGGAGGSGGEGGQGGKNVGDITSTARQTSIKMLMAEILMAATPVTPMEETLEPMATATTKKHHGRCRSTVASTKTRTKKTNR